MKAVFHFTAEIQDGHQKWQPNDFWEISPDNSAHTGGGGGGGGAKIRKKIALSRTVSDINVF